MKLSIVIPVHNEETTITQIIEKVFALNISPWEKEVIVVNDGSSDATGPILNSISSKFNARDNLKMLDLIVINHPINLGKGAAIQTGLTKVSGDYIIIQDADSEYDPSDIPHLLSLIPDGSSPAASSPKEAGNKTAVFGKRGYKTYPERGFHYVIGAWILTQIYNLLYHQRLTDLYTGYKLIPTRLFKELNIQSQGFEFEAEVACKLAKRGVIIKEIPIHYRPRNKAQGKHIKFSDAVKGLIKILDLKLRD